jgi:hypothetical protein
MLRGYVLAVDDVEEALEVDGLEIRDEDPHREADEGLGATPAGFKDGDGTCGGIAFADDDEASTGGGEGGATESGFRTVTNPSGEAARPSVTGTGVAVAGTMEEG